MRLSLNRHFQCIETNLILPMDPRHLPGSNKEPIVVEESDSRNTKWQYLLLLLMFVILVFVFVFKVKILSFGNSSFSLAHSLFHSYLSAFSISLAVHWSLTTQATAPCPCNLLGFWSWCLDNMHIVKEEQHIIKGKACIKPNKGCNPIRGFIAFTLINPFRMR